MGGLTWDWLNDGVGDFHWGLEIFKMVDQAQHEEVGGGECLLLTQASVAHSMAHSCDMQTGARARARYP